MNISIAMATYNGERFLQEQLDSLAAQTLLPCELVVGDDGSTDGTLEILERFAKRAPFAVRIQRNETNLGYGANFLSTASRCSAAWIAFCDQDDVWRADKLSAVAELVSRLPDVKLFVHEVTVCDEALRPISYRAVGILRSGKFSPGTGAYRIAAGCSMVFSRELLQCADWRSWNLPGRPGEGVAHDWWIGNLAYAIAPRYLCTAPLVQHRRHGQAVTNAYTHGWRAKLGRVLSTTAEDLRAAGDLMEDAEEWFRRQAIACEPSRGFLFVQAANMASARARVYGLRAALYDATDYLRKGSKLAQLFADREYRRSFTIQEHAKDFLRAATPQRIGVNR